MASTCGKRIYYPPPSLVSVPKFMCVMQGSLVQLGICHPPTILSNIIWDGMLMIVNSLRNAACKRVAAASKSIKSDITKSKGSITLAAWTRCLPHLFILA
jgi:hypothetical protein